MKEYMNAPKVIYTIIEHSADGSLPVARFTTRKAAILAKEKWFVDSCYTIVESYESTMVVHASLDDYEQN